MKIRNERKEDTMEIKVIYWIIFTEQNLTEIKKKIIWECHKQLYANKLSNTDEMKITRKKQTVKSDSKLKSEYTYNKDTEEW